MVAEEKQRMVVERTRNKESAVFLISPRKRDYYNIATIRDFLSS